MWTVTPIMVVTLQYPTSTERYSDNPICATFNTRQDNPHTASITPVDSPFVALVTVHIQTKSAADGLALHLLLSHIADRYAGLLVMLWFHAAQP
jgi:hypothetical protein